MVDFNKFLDVAQIGDLPKFETALHFIYFLSKTENKDGILPSEINKLFERAHLAKYNVTYLKRDLTKSRRTTVGKTKGTFKLSRQILLELDGKYKELFNGESKIEISEAANLHTTPFLKGSDVAKAHQMAQLYIVLHCYENSVRHYIEKILGDAKGTNWFSKSANSTMLKKYEDRKLKETKGKWISPRGNVSPLYYLDWSDLLTLIRKFPDEFSQELPDVKFIELRFEELERVRNIVAHNGVLPDEDDFNRLLLSFKDWCRQLG